jgi:hypothetical protein
MVGFMDIILHINNGMYAEAGKSAEVGYRSIAEQIEYWATIGKAALDNPELPIEFIQKIIVARKCNRELAEPFVPTVRHGKN